MATAVKTKKLVREFAFDHATPGTNRFRQDEEEDGERPAIGTLYITKKAIVGELEGNITRIRVTVEAIG